MKYALMIGGLLATRVVGQIETHKLMSNGAQPFDQAGYALAFDGDDILIGAPHLDDLPNTPGKVFAFESSSCLWAEAQAPLAPPILAGPYPCSIPPLYYEPWFGRSVDISGDVAVVGAPQEDVAPCAQPENVGYAYVYTRSAGAWSLTQRLQGCAGPTQSSRFGWSVTTNSDVIAIGAPRDAHSSLANAGRVHVFTRTSATNWTCTQVLESGNAQVNCAFGTAVDLAGDRLVVGEPNAAGQVPNSSGSAWVFKYNGLSWNPESHLVPPDGQASDEFGNALAIEAERIVVGAFRHEHAPASPNADHGSAYVYRLMSSGWTFEDELALSAGGTQDYLGFSVAITHSDTIALGAPGADISGTNVGAAYVFVRNGAQWQQSAVLTAVDAAGNDQLGYSVGVYGHKLVAGAPRENEKGVDAGAVYVFDLTASPLPSIQPILSQHDPAGSLVLHGLPAVGAPVAAELCRPCGAPPIGSIGLLAFAAAPFLPGPIGLTMSGWGLCPQQSADGEIMLSLLPPQPFFIMPRAVYLGAPCKTFQLTIPPDCGLVGTTFYLQGGIVSALPTGPMPGLSEAVALTIRS